MLFLIPCSSPAYLCLSAQVNSCCGMNAVHTGAQTEARDVLNINLYSICLSLRFVISPYNKLDNVSVSGCGELQHSI